LVVKGVAEQLLQKLSRC